jgi:hypothetical protein
MEKQQISGLVSILISAAIAIAALWGYNIVVVQPLAEQMAKQSSAWQNTADPSTGAGQVLYGTEVQGGDRAVGETNLTNLVTSGAVAVAGTPVAVQVGAHAGQAIICGSTTITGTGTLPHGLATPSFVTLGLAQDVTGNGGHLSASNASGTVTVKAWSSALTPAAATTPVAVNWCVNGTK